jgi:hypothetical protein
MKISQSALSVLLLCTSAAAFVPSRPTLSRISTTSTIANAATKQDADIAVPYDAAARLAYDEWRNKYSKGDFDATRYEFFKNNYETITIANVVAKKEAREQKKDAVPLMTLNEFGDFSEEEFKARQSGDKPAASDTKTISTGDVLGKAVAAAEKQSEASGALKEAADALAEDEEALAQKLGLQSVEELEVAIDSLEGIAADGGELDKENLSREARVRAAYLNWCKEYKKEPDEDRFLAFSDNFLVMEKFAQDTGKEMALNEFADLTETEYKEKFATKSKPRKETTPAVSKNATPSSKVKVAEVVKNLFTPAVETPAEKVERETRAKAIAEQRKAQEAADATRRQDIEKERAERQKQQDQELAKAKTTTEQAVIAAAKEEAEREAQKNAARRKIEQQAAEQARQKAREWDEKQKKMSVSSTQSLKKTEPKPAPTLDLSSFFPTPAPQKEAAPDPAKAKVEAPKKKAPSTPSFGSFFSPPSPKTVPAPKAAPAPVPTPVKTKKPTVKSSPTFNLGSFFAPSPAPKQKEAPQPAPIVESEEVDVADPVTEAFNSFFGSGKKKTEPKPSPAPAPVKKAPVKSNPTFSFFSSPTPAPAPKPAPAPVPSKANPTFSFFSPPKPAPTKKEEPKVPNRPGTLSLFDFSPKPGPEKEDKPKMSNRPGTLSLFGSGTPNKDPKPEKRVQPKVPNRKGTISLFGGNAKTPTPAPQKKKEPVKRPTLSLFGSPKKKEPEIAPEPVKQKQAFSFFGGGGGSKSAAAPKDKIPVLSRWKQNPNGSITGIISNSPNFRSGTEITTSPVKRGAKAGSVIKTGSGSQYRLS